MKTNSYGEVIYEDQDLIDLLYSGEKDLLPKVLCDLTDDIEKFVELSGIKINSPEDHGTVESFDESNQKNWLMPTEYKAMDIEGYLVHVCPKENYQRLIEELAEFRSRNMLDLLRWLKYLVDTCRSKEIVWGVGRGSSVGSYVLYLIGVHRIDPIKYKLSWQEFLR
jgi:DNA polymerase III alpha subunit